MKRVLIIALCLSSVLALAGCRTSGRAPLTGSGTASSSETAAPVAAPVLGGLDTTAAVAALTASGLKLGTVTQSYSETIPAGVLISQKPASGAKAPKGSTVEIVVSKGPAPVLVPSVLNKSEADATKVLKTAGFLVVPSQKADDATKGVVIAQDPNKGSAPRGSLVRITVSTGSTKIQPPGSLLGKWKASDGSTYTFRHGGRVVVPSGGVVRYRSSGGLLLIFHPVGVGAVQNIIKWDSPNQFTLTALKSDRTEGPTVTYKRQ
jgi:hypothetical protein